MFKELLARLADLLDQKGIPYMIIGGQAVLLYGEPRLTRDIDSGLFHSSIPYFFSFLHSETLSMPSIWAARVLFPPTSFKTHFI